MDYPENVKEMINDFQFLTDWEDRYMHVIDMGKLLPSLNATEKTDTNKVLKNLDNNAEKYILESLEIMKIKVKNLKNLKVLDI